MLKLINHFVKKKDLKQVDSEEDKIITTGGDTISLGSIVLNGKLSGDFYAKKMLTVDRDAYLSGKIISTDGTIKGRVEGNIVCTGKLYIESTAMIKGSITAGTAEIAAGSIINGSILLVSEVEACVLSKKIKIAEKLLEKEVVLQPAMPKPEEVPRTDKTFKPVVKSNAKHAVRHSSSVDESNDGWW